MKQLFSVIWYNSKKLGINFLGAYAITKFSMFIGGLYLSSNDVSSYGLMMQLVSILTGVSSALFATYVPKISSLRVNKDRDGVIRTFAFAMNCFYTLFVIGSVMIVLAGPPALSLIGSNAVLPSNAVIIIFLMITLLENNHGNFATFITTGNNVPFVKAAIVAGTLICLGDFLVLQFTNLGLLGIVLVQGTVQLAYNNWYWPKYVLDGLRINYLEFIIAGLNETSSIIRKNVEKLYGRY